MNNFENYIININNWININRFTTRHDCFKWFIIIKSTILWFINLGSYTSQFICTTINFLFFIYFHFCPIILFPLWVIYLNISCCIHIIFIIKPNRTLCSLYILRCLILTIFNNNIFISNLFIKIIISIASWCTS